MVQKDAKIKEKEILGTSLYWEKCQLPNFCSSQRSTKTQCEIVGIYRMFRESYKELVINYFSCHSSAEHLHERMCEFRGPDINHIKVLNNTNEIACNPSVKTAR